MNKIWKVIRHNQFVTLAVVIVIALGIWLIGCESKTTSPISNKKVTRSQLIIENDTYIANLKLAQEDLDKQDLFKQKIFEIGLAAAQGGTIDPIGAGVTLLGILGIGTVADNRRKDVRMKTLQSTVNALTAKITTDDINAEVKLNS